MSEHLPEEPKPDTEQTPQEWQNFQRLAKGLFAVPKSEMDAVEHEQNKQARTRQEVKPTVPQK